MKMVRLNCIEEKCSFRTQDLEFDHAEKLLCLHLDRRHPQNGSPPMEMDPDKEHKKEAKEPRVLNSKETLLRMSNHLTKKHCFRGKLLHFSAIISST